jgi:hypothetical protein
MRDYSIDEWRTAAGYRIHIFQDNRQRSHFNNLGHIFMRGCDRVRLWEELYLEQKGLCAICGRWRERGKLDLDHMKGNTKKTRCDCYGQVLNDGTICTGVRLICTMDPAKGGNPKSCHARKHNREPQWSKKGKADA